MIQQDTSKVGLTHIMRIYDYYRIPPKVGLNRRYQILQDSCSRLEIKMSVITSPEMADWRYCVWCVVWEMQTVGYDIQYCFFQSVLKQN